MWCYTLWRCFIQTLNGAFNQCGFMALMLENPFFVNSFPFQHSKFRIGVLLQFLIKNMQNHLLPQKHFIEIAVYYVSQKESAEDVTENYHHFLIHQENITHIYIFCEDGNYEYLNLFFFLGACQWGIAGCWNWSDIFLSKVAANGCQVSVFGHHSLTSKSFWLIFAWFSLQEGS